MYRILLAVVLACLTACGGVGRQDAPAAGRNDSSPPAPAAPAGGPAEPQRPSAGGGLPERARVEGRVGDAPVGKVDIKSLAVESDGKNLIVNLEAANDLTQLFMKRDPGVVAVLQIDTDLNASTGGSPFFSEATGIEYHVDVQVCVKYKRGEISATVCVGGISGTPVRTGIISDISVGRYEGNGAANAKGVSVESREGTVAGETIKVIIPYGYIGVESGRGIRILGALSEEWNPKTGKYPMLPEIKVRLK